MNKVIFRIYDSIHLGLGIKKGLRELIFWFDNKIVFPLNNLLNSYLTKRIINHYGADYLWNDQLSQNIDKDKSNLGYGLVHKALIRSQRPKRILCVGSMYGFIPFMMAWACNENKRGHVDFVDAGFDLAKKEDRNKHSFGMGFWKNTDLNKHFSYLLDPKYITCYIMTTEEFAKKYHRKYDYIYLDGDHTYHGAKKDFKLFWPRLENRGLLCFHDIHFKKVLRGIVFGYWKIWQELSLKPYKLEISNLYSGLGIIQKLSPPKTK